MYRHLCYHHTSARGLAVTDAPKWVCAARRRPSTNHARPLHLRLHPYPNLQAAPFGLCCESSARCPLLPLLSCCLSPLLASHSASERCLQSGQSSACLSVCQTNPPTHHLPVPVPACLRRRHPFSHPAKALHLTSTDCSGALIRDVYESQLDPVSVCHPTPQSALIVAVQTLLTSLPATCLHSSSIFTGYSLPLPSKHRRHPWPSPPPATLPAARLPLSCTRLDTSATSLLICLSVCLSF